MKRLPLLPRFAVLAALLVAFAPARAARAVDRPTAEKIKAAGGSLGGFPGGGTAVTFRSAKSLTAEVWKLLEAIDDLRSFWCSEGLDDAQLQRLCKIKSLEQIILNGAVITDAGLPALAGPPRLRYFCAHHSFKYSGTGFAALAHCPNFVRLEIGAGDVDDEGLRVIAGLGQLQEFVLGGTHVTSVGFPELARLKGLRKLHFSTNWYPFFTAADFVRLAPLENLEELSIGRMVLPFDDGLSHLMRLGRLKKLTLGGCVVTPDDLAKLRAALPGVAVEHKQPGEQSMVENWNRSLPDRGKTYKLEGLQVTITAPQAVGRRTECFWYPNLMRFADGRLALSIRVGDDRLTADDALLAWSKDGGRTWSDPQPYAGQSFSYLPLPSGEMALLPHHLYRAAEGCQAPLNIADSKGHVRRVENGVAIHGFPRPFGKDPFNDRADVAQAVKLGRVTVSFNGTPLRMKDGTYLTIVYGLFGDARRCSTLAAESKDGLKWRIRSTIADEACKLGGNEGPCEACLCRLRDGRLMCVFRRGWETYGQCWSSDEGKTWTEAVAMQHPGKVEPKLLVLPSGTVVLAGGRPGLDLWFDRSGTGEQWQAIDTLAHHNGYLPQEPIKATHLNLGTSSYVGIVALDANTFLYVYDRVPAGFRVCSNWKADPQDAGKLRETFGVFIARVTVR